jgi:hypothetical protein
MFVSVKLVIYVKLNWWCLIRVFLYFILLNYKLINVIYFIYICYVIKKINYITTNISLINNMLKYYHIFNINL